MTCLKITIISSSVALRKESVDRNQRIAKPFREQFVALRKESVDRNCNAGNSSTAKTASLSARRAWIEMTTYFETSSIDDVALRKESVDRNNLGARLIVTVKSRSPQGERG